MAGVILENLNIKKLLAFATGMLLLQVICFLLGGLIAPSPFHAENILSTICIVPEQHGSQAVHSVNESFTDPTLADTLPFYYIWPKDHANACPKHVQSVTELWNKNYSTDQIVFVIQFPLRRSGKELDMSRWFQQVVSMLNFDMIYRKELPLSQHAEITMDVRLGYRNVGEPSHQWHEIAHSREIRPMRCNINQTHSTSSYFWGESTEPDKMEEGYNYDCEMMPLFTLGSCHYDFYVVNIRIPIDPINEVNSNIGGLENIWMVEIHQNGGFTKVWFSLKTFMFPFNVIALAFFHRRLRELPRFANVLEGSIFTMGIAMSLLNVPLEWLSLWINLPFWLLVSDLRQGLFYAFLLSFWVVFVGEHAMDDEAGCRRSVVGSWNGCFLPFRLYWRPLSAVALGSLCLLIFDLAERGVQLHNPFYSADAYSGGSVASICLAAVIIAALCAGLYLCHLLFYVQKTLRQVWSKRRLLPSLPEARQRFYSGVIYRFTILIVYTFICAILTVAFYIVSQIDEDSWKWGEKRLEYSSAFITGVYGMWNVYVFTILCLYAPSHKGGRPGQVADHLLLSDHRRSQCFSSTSAAVPHVMTLSSNSHEIVHLSNTNLSAVQDDNGTSLPGNNITQETSLSGGGGGSSGHHPPMGMPPPRATMIDASLPFLNKVAQE